MIHPTHSEYFSHIRHLACCMWFFFAAIAVNAQEDTRYKYIFDLVNDGNYEAAKTEVTKSGVRDISMSYTTTRSSSFSGHKTNPFSIFLIPFIIMDGLTPKTAHHSITLLEFSVAKGHAASKNDFIQFLLKRGFNPNTYYGQLSPIAIAVSKNENELAKLLFWHGAKPWGRGMDREDNAFLIALRNNNKEMIGFFFENRVEFPQAHAGTDLLASAMASGDTATLGLFLSSDISPRSTELTERTASIIRKEKKQISDSTYALMLKKLAAKGFKADSADRDGNLPLHAALKEGCEGLALAILPYTVNVNKQNLAGETPLMLAVKQAPMKSVQALLDRGADIGLKNKEGQTARDIAVRKNHMAIADLLESTDAGVRGRNEKLALLLLDNHVPQKTRTDSAIALIRAGISMDACRIRPYVSKINPNYSGPCYFLHHAVKKGDYEIAEELLKAGADPNVQDGKENELPLKYALSYGDTNMARLLLNYGADPGHFQLKKSVMFYMSYGGETFSRLCAVRDLLLREILEDIHSEKEADGRYYYADPKGHNLFSFTADSILPFAAQGYARVKQNGRWNLADLTGQFVLEDYDSICEPETVSSFFDDSETVVRASKNGSWYFKRPPYRDGEKAYRYISPFVFSDHDGYSYALCEDTGGFGFMDSRGFVKGLLYSKITQKKGKISGVLPDGKTKRIKYEGSVPAYFLKSVAPK